RTDARAGCDSAATAVAANTAHAAGAANAATAAAVAAATGATVAGTTQHDITAECDEKPGAKQQFG
ncbi:MAG: hypothetical protein QOF70_3258, partial [Acetobacteraceae bacterium]|nr:hypothetical protein [Acetobacteraceae bacterium]